jgi:hypothetical protein
MHKPALRIIIPLVVTAVIAGLFYYRIDRLLVRTSEVIPKMDYILNNKDSNDIVIIGSSRAYYHFDPRIIDSVCKVKSYNLGINGSAIVEQNMVLNTYLAYHPAPKVVLLNVDFLDFDSKMVVSNSLDYMQYLSVPEVKKNIGSFAHYKYALLAPLLRVQRAYSVPNDAVRVTTLFGSDDKLTAICRNTGIEAFYGHPYKGYQPNNAPLDGDARHPADKITVQYDTVALNMLNDMIRLCKSRSIIPVLVYAPLYHTYSQKFEGYTPLMNNIKGIAKQNDILFMDYSVVAYSDDSSRFYNITHLNSKGSRLFSTQLANDLKHKLHINE